MLEGGRFSTESPGRHSVAGRIGRGENPPPQFGHTLCSLFSTQSAQNVHSYEQIRASGEAGGKSWSHHSQFGRSSRATIPSLLEASVNSQSSNVERELKDEAARLRPRLKDGEYISKTHHFEKSRFLRLSACLGRYLRGGGAGVAVVRRFLRLFAESCG